VITGFNTDIVHDGVTYHVQTEDKGLASPLILSLVYTGGTILASKRASYDDLIAEGFNEKTLSERLQRQHKLICAAIRAGRIEELKLMSQREASVRSAQKAEQKETQQPTVQAAPQRAESEQSAAVVEPEKLPAAEPAQAPARTFKPRQQQPARAPLPLRSSPTPIIMRPAPPGDFEFADASGGAEEELNLQLIEDRDFHAGDVVALRIRVSRGAGGEQDSVSDAAVTVKVLGTTFRPLICSAMTDRDGMAVVFTTLPRFASGRAAILIRAVSGHRDAEMRRIILPSR
jgi:hypothetical protein